MQAQLVGVRLPDGDLLFSTSTASDAPGLIYLRDKGWVPIALSATTIYSRGGWVPPPADAVAGTRHLLAEAGRRLGQVKSQSQPVVDTVAP